MIGTKAIIIVGMAVIAPSISIAETVRVDRLTREMEIAIQRGATGSQAECFWKLLYDIRDAGEVKSWRVTFEEGDYAIRFTHRDGRHVASCGENGLRVVRKNTAGKVVSDRTKPYSN